MTLNAWHMSGRRYYKERHTTFDMIQSISITVLYLCLATTLPATSCVAANIQEIYSIMKNFTSTKNISYSL